MSPHAVAQDRLSATLPSIDEPFDRTSRHSAGLGIRRAGGVGMDVLMLLAVVLSIPFVILAVGIPIALVARLMLWVGRLL
jgi:hypothetical protein